MKGIRTHDYFTYQLRHRNTIHSIKSDSGDLATTQADIAYIFESHFKERFRAANSHPVPTHIVVELNRITVVENDGLCLIPDGEEIRSVIKSMSPYKSPEPDGFPTAFYQNY